MGLSLHFWWALHRRTQTASPRVLPSPCSRQAAQRSPSPLLPGPSFFAQPARLRASFLPPAWKFLLRWWLFQPTGMSTGSNQHSIHRASCPQTYHPRRSPASRTSFEVCKLRPQTQSSQSASGSSRLSSEHLWHGSSKSCLSDAGGAWYTRRYKPGTSNPWVLWPPLTLQNCPSRTASTWCAFHPAWVNLATLDCHPAKSSVVTALVRGAQFHPEKPQLAGPAVKAVQFQPEKPQLAVPAVKVAPRASLLLAASLKLARNKSGTEQTTRRGRLGIGQAIYGCIGASVKLVLLRH